MFDNNARLKSIISRKRSGRTNQFTAGTSSEHRPETKQKIAETLDGQIEFSKSSLGGLASKITLPK